MALMLSDTEVEVVLLKAVKELVDSLVNPEILQVTGQDPDSEIRFHSSTHQRFFNIVLADFLSATDKRAPIRHTSYLGGLRSIADHPAFDAGNSINSLKAATADFAKWLEEEVEVTTWLSSLKVETCLKLSRLVFLKMCGDISKHNFLRAIGVAEELQKVLSNSGVSVTLEEALLSLTDFYEQFHTNILGYHSSTIAEFLNNIRWGIYEYLQPEFQRSIVWESRDPLKYRYTYPREVVVPFVKQCYWDLMNEVRSPPYMKFKVTKWLKLRY